MQQTVYLLRWHISIHILSQTIELFNFRPAKFVFNVWEKLDIENAIPQHWLFSNLSANFDVPIVNICRCDYQLWKKMPDFWEKFGHTTRSNQEMHQKLPFLPDGTALFSPCDDDSDDEFDANIVYFWRYSSAEFLALRYQHAKSENSVARCVSGILPLHHSHHPIIIKDHQSSWRKTFVEWNYISAPTFALKSICCLWYFHNSS